MPSTALQHFAEDIARAKSLLHHADTLMRATPEQNLLRSDILRSSWMFAIGAFDAYFCDAYSDVLAAVMVAKSRQPSMELPDSFLNIKFPVRAILEEYDKNQNWRWRMAARDLMERENVLSFESIQKLFNKFCRRNHKFFLDLIERWIDHPQARARLFGITKYKFQKLNPKDKEQARKDAANQLAERFAELFQRRHDCIHNCDRPRRQPQELSVSGHVFKVIQDVEFLVARCDEHLNVETREFLLSCKCLPMICGSVGY